MMPQAPGPQGRARIATVGRFQIRDRLGEGGMGVLYLALDPAIDRLIALKLLRADSVELRERFIREAQIAARLQHPHIVTIYDVGSHEGQPFIAMEYIPGETLAELIRRRAPLAVSRRLLLMADVCQGLAYAHKRNVIHRDVKPANLMVSRDTGVVKVLDFGIARGGESALTQAGVLVGTPNYMSPEQVHGDVVDHRSDIFAVGAVLHELLVYRRAFSDDNPHVVLHKILHLAPQPVTEINRDLPPAIVPILDRAMAKRAADRYPDLDTLRNDLVRLAQRIAADQSADTIVEPAGAQHAAAEKRPDSGGSNKARLMERRAARIGAHMHAAAVALAAGRCDEALVEAELAEELDPDHAPVIELLNRVHAARTAHDVARALDEVRQHMQAGALTEAGAALSRASKLAPGSPDLQALRRQLDAAVEERERKREFARKADLALAQARESLQAGVLDAALRAVIEALGYEPEREDALGLRRTVESEIRKVEQQRQARDRLIDTALAQARDLATQNRIEAAIDLLARFRPADTRVLEALATLREEIVERERSWRAAEERRAREAIERAHAFQQQGRFGEAIDELDRFAPAHALVADALAALRAGHASRARATVREADALVARNQAAEALALLEAFDPPDPLVTDALMRLRTDRAAREARQQVDQAARRWQDEEQQRRRALDEWLARRLHETQTALDGGRFEEAIAAAQRTLDTVPDCAQAARLLDAAVERQAAREAAAARDANVQAHLHAARTRAEAGDFGAALAHLVSADAFDPTNAEIAGLRDAIEQRRAAAEEQARRDAHDRRAADLVASARAQFGAGAYQHALKRLARFAPPHAVVREAHRELSAQLASIERERAEADKRAHEARLVQLREEQRREEQLREEDARAPDTVTGGLDAEAPTQIVDALDRAPAVVLDATLDRSTDAAAFTRTDADPAPVRALLARGRDLAKRKPAHVWGAAASIAILAMLGTSLLLRETPAQAGPPSSSPSRPGTGAEPVAEKPADKAAASAIPSSALPASATSATSTAPTAPDSTPPVNVPGDAPLHRSTLLVDASPWARIVRIVDAKGQPLGGVGAYTPVALAVAAGTYTVTLERDGQRRSEQITIGERESKTARVEFEQVDTAEFFRNQP